MGIVSRSQGGGGSSQPQTITAQVTTDANTYVASHVFDLGNLTLLQIRLTFLSSVGAGETFGSAVGNVCVLFSHAESADNVAFFGLAPVWGNPFDNVDANANTSSPGQYEDRCVASPRYVRITATIGDSNSNPYAGPNHPTATVRLDVKALTS